jgi:hypothetical protein
VSPAVSLLLYAEVVVCFAPTLINLSLGIALTPTWIDLLLSIGSPGAPAELDYGPLRSIAFVIAGCLGSTGIVLILCLIGGWRPNRPAIRLVWLLIAIGVGATVAFPLTMVGFSRSLLHKGNILVVVLPLVCTIHLVYLARHQLIRRAAA